MRVLVNALSVTNQSGRHVLMGHLNQLRRWTEGEHDFVVLYHATNQDIVTEANGYHWIECPPKTAGWLGRSSWEYRHLNRVAKANQCDFLFTPAGVTVPGVELPQVVFCQNPWCLVPELHVGFQDRFKALLQRRGYRNTMRHAELMVFNSEYMHQAYRENAGTDAQRAMVVYQAISEATWAAAERLGKSLRQDNHIVCVSAMGSHKGADVLVRAVRHLHDRGLKATLTFAGGWPDPTYRRSVEVLTDRLRLRDSVVFSGWISDEELHALYSRAHVFCLLSRCESFGIPAVEAQSFGTPALGTSTCAIPEIGGDGGLYSPVDDDKAAADNLARVLGDDTLWKTLSRQAQSNAERFRWSECSRPLLKMFDIIGSLR